jgi:predicted house-cleaning noncanonical NTP pyrophosphatase (MazG superfamily)
MLPLSMANKMSCLLKEGMWTQYILIFKTGSKYEMVIEHDIFSGLGDDRKSKPIVGSDDDKNNKASPELNSGNRAFQEGDETNPNVMAALDGLTVIPVLGNAQTLSRKKYQGRFDFVFLSQHAAHWMRNPEFKSALGNQAVVEVETGKFVYQLKKKDQLQLLEKINSIASASGFRKEEMNACESEELTELDCNSLRFHNA